MINCVLKPKCMRMFPAEVCCRQRINVRYRICVVRSESDFRL
jgi:hypothetical protein